MKDQLCVDFDQEIFYFIYGAGFALFVFDLSDKPFADFINIKEIHIKPSKCLRIGRKWLQLFNNRANVGRAWCHVDYLHLVLLTERDTLEPRQLGDAGARLRQHLREARVVERGAFGGCLDFDDAA